MLFFRDYISGIVTSPNYPDNYPDRLEKTELVQVEQGMILSIEFFAFDIDFDPVLCDLNCNCDHLTITDGDGTTLMGKSCGSTSNSTAIFEGRLIGSSLPPAIVSRSNSISIVFKTGSLGSKSGWKVNWKAVAPGKRGLKNNIFSHSKWNIVLNIRRSVFK